MERGASCCFPGVENQYDATLLLANLLLNCSLPRQGLIAGACFFVGPQGCRLLARHYYCQRFLCREVQTLLGPARVEAIQARVATELAAGWELEQALRQRLRQGDTGLTATRRAG